MSIDTAADTALVVYRVLVLASVICCALVSISFALFARDQVAGASKHQQNEIVASDQTTVTSVPVHHAKQQPRRFIDAAASDLTAPFRTFVHSNSQWALHLAPTLIALLFYGVGLGYLARFSRGLH